MVNINLLLNVSYCHRHCLSLAILQTRNYRTFSLGNGLSKKAANELGLLPGTPVGTSMIDAHAGGLGLIGCAAEGIDPNFETRVGNFSLFCIVNIFIFTFPFARLNMRYIHMPYGSIKRGSFCSWSLGSL